MPFKASRCAVIGAGVSGLTSAKHLKAAGVEVVVYERSSVSGGVWSYTERRPLEPSYPALRPSVADFVADPDAKVSIQKSPVDEQNGAQVDPQVTEDIDLVHAPPGPAYDGLKNNIPTPLQELKGHPWKEGTEDFVNVRVIGEYLQSFSKTFDVEPLIKFNTRVEELEKIEGGKKWRVRSSTLIIDGPEKGRKIREVEEFDAVVVANGHYHACRVPDIPGLKEWKAAWPSRVQHSKGYRTPNDFKDQNVLLIGGGVSSTDIAKEIAPIARKVYQSARESPFRLPLSFLPPSAERVADIASFAIPTSPQDTPGEVVLTDGRILTGIDRVVVCTGYHITYPFLPSLHNDFLAREAAGEEILVTDGTQVHNLHKDIFYIPDPTLAFVGIPFFSATFTLFEIQAIVVSKVLSGQAWVPSKEEMRKEYRERVEKKGYGRAFHSVMNEEVEYVADLVAWVNAQAEATGGEKMEGHTEKWLAQNQARLVRMKEAFNETGPSPKPEATA